MQGISNKTIVNFFAEKTSDEVKKNYWCFSNISFHSMMTESGAVNLFIIMNTDRSDKKGTYCFLDLHTKKRSFYSIVLVSKVLNSSFFKMIKRYSIKYFMVSKKLMKKTIKSL